MLRRLVLASLLALAVNWRWARGQMLPPCAPSCQKYPGPVVCAADSFGNGRTFANECEMAAYNCLQQADYVLTTRAACGQPPEWVFPVDADLDQSPSTANVLLPGMQYANPQLTEDDDFDPLERELMLLTAIRKTKFEHVKKQASVQSGHSCNLDCPTPDTGPVCAACGGFLKAFPSACALATFNCRHGTSYVRIPKAVEQCMTAVIGPAETADECVVVSPTEDLKEAADREKEEGTTAPDLENGGKTKCSGNNCGRKLTGKIGGVKPTATSDRLQATSPTARGGVGSVRDRQQKTQAGQQQATAKRKNPGKKTPRRKKITSRYQERRISKLYVS